MRLPSKFLIHYGFICFHLNKVKIILSLEFLNAQGIV